MNTSTFGDESSGEHPLVRIADALEVHNTLYLAYLHMAFSKGMVEVTLDELGEGENYE